MANLKYHSLRDKVFNISNLYKAFYKVKRNKGAYGVDKVSIKEFEKNLDDNILAIHKKLKSQDYDPMSIQRTYIPKGKNKFRPLGIPTVRDRVIQQAFLQILEPIFEPYFHDNSFGFRPKRSAQDAIKKVWFLKKEGYYHVVDMDIKEFFDNIDHRLIIDLVRQKVADGWVLRAITSMLKAPILEDGKAIKPTKGTPQGGVISPLLANIVLNELDWWLHQKGVHFVRYADDFVCLTKIGEEALQLMEEVQGFLQEKLRLEISKEKSKVTDFWRGFTFLGYKFKANRITVREKSISKFKDNIRSLTIRSHNSSNRNMKELINKKINPVIRGFVNYFMMAECSMLFTRDLDCWVRMRLRAMKVKRISKLDNLRMRNKRFRKMGLVSLYEIYNLRNIKLRYTN